MPAALAAAVYWPVRGFPFVNIDDQRYVYANPWVARGLPLDGLRWALGSFDASNPPRGSRGSALAPQSEWASARPTQAFQFRSVAAEEALRIDPGIAQAWGSDAPLR